MRDKGTFKSTGIASTPSEAAHAALVHLGTKSNSSQTFTTDAALTDLLVASAGVTVNPRPGAWGVGQEGVDGLQIVLTDGTWSVDQKKRYLDALASVSDCDPRGYRDKHRDQVYDLVQQSLGITSKMPEDTQAAWRALKCEYVSLDPSVADTDEWAILGRDEAYSTRNGKDTNDGTPTATATATETATESMIDIDDQGGLVRRIGKLKRPEVKAAQERADAARAARAREMAKREEERQDQDRIIDHFFDSSFIDQGNKKTGNLSFSTAFSSQRQYYDSHVPDLSAIAVPFSNSDTSAAGSAGPASASHSYDPLHDLSLGKTWKSYLPTSSLFLHPISTLSSLLFANHEAGARVTKGDRSTVNTALDNYLQHIDGTQASQYRITRLGSAVAGGLARGVGSVLEVLGLIEGDNGVEDIRPLGEAVYVPAGMGTMRLADLRIKADRKSREEQEREYDRAMQEEEERAKKEGRSWWR